MEAVGLKWLHMVLLKDQNEHASLGGFEDLNV